MTDPFAQLQAIRHSIAARQDVTFTTAYLTDSDGECGAVVLMTRDGQSGQVQGMGETVDDALAALEADVKRVFGET